MGIFTVIIMPILFPIAAQILFPDLTYNNNRQMIIGIPSSIFSLSSIIISIWINMWISLLIGLSAAFLYLYWSIKDLKPSFD